MPFTRRIKISFFMEYQQLDFMDISESIKNYLRTFSQKKNWWDGNRSKIIEILKINKKIDQISNNMHIKVVLLKKVIYVQ